MFQGTELILPPLSAATDRSKYTGLMYYKLKPQVVSCNLMQLPYYVCNTSFILYKNAFTFKHWAKYCDQ